jgi:hypothetical protein
MVLLDLEGVRAVRHAYRYHTEHEQPKSFGQVFLEGIIILALIFAFVYAIRQYASPHDGTAGQLESSIASK